MKKLPALFLLALCLSSVRADVPATIRPIAAGLGGYNYWGHGVFSNTLYSSSEWLEFGTGQWGSRAYFLNEDGTPNPQFNSRGLPQYLNPGMKFRVLMWPYDTQPSSEPAGWPKRGMTGAGKWVITWQGDADIRLQGGTFVAAESSGASTGRLVNGRRVYQMAATNPSGHIVIEDINSAVPLSDLKVWLPDPANPTGQSLENSGQFWHPRFLENIAAMEFGSIRFMDWGSTNGSPQRDWLDRRQPQRIFQGGVLNRRSPAEGIVWYTNSSGQPVYLDGNRPTGIAYEYMVDLCNRTGRDMWLCVPHMATDDYVIKLAQLLRYGSDGVNPYTSLQANPVFPPLNPELNVWLEYSNEIWSNGDSFPQGNWAEAQAIAAGFGSGNTGKAKFNARRASQIWSQFQQVFGGSQRIVRIGAIWTGQTAYTDPFMVELRDYGLTRSPAVQPDVISPTTYFGNGIQDWAYEQANLNRQNPDKSWFHTAEDFVFNTTTGATRPVSKPISDPYWTSQKLSQDLSSAFDQWKTRIFSGSTVGGGGFDTTGVNGGFSAALAQSILTTFGAHKPIISYEGGPSLYTDYLDAGDVRDDGVTNFLTVMNRRAEFEEIYRVQLNMARAKGLTCHGLFVDISRAGKYGQWGHLEYLDQPYAEAPKWQAVQRWGDDMIQIRNPLFPLGAVPSFTTPGILPQATYLQSYSTDIVATGGDVAAGSALEWQVVGSMLDPGLTVAPVPGDPTRYRIQGTPQRGGWNYLYLRVNDDDGDAAWQVFSLYTPGGPGSLLESIITGTTSAASVPYTTSQSIDSSRITWTGLSRGAVNVSTGGSANGSDGTGVRIDAGTNCIRFAVSQGAANEAESTLQSAITDNEYLTYTITPQPGQPLDLRNAEFQFVWDREQYHSPRNLAVFSSIGGFAAGQQLYTSPYTTSTEQQVTVAFRLPETTAYAGVTAPVQFRIYFYGSQYAHLARFYSLKLTRDLGSVVPNDPLPPVFSPGSFTRPDATDGMAYSATLSGAASDPNLDPVTYSKVSGPAWLSVAANGALTGTPGSSNNGTNVFTVRASDPGNLSGDGTLTIQVLAAPVANPVFTPGAGTFNGPVTVALSSATPGSAIRYTTNGTNPTSTTGTLYSGPFLLNSTTTVRAIAYKSGSADSAVTSATYTISNSAAAGTFLQSGTNDVIMEAENFVSQTANGDTKTWAAATSIAGYQGPSYVTTADTGASSPSWNAGTRVDYPVQFSSTGTGTYYIWARVRAPDANGNEAWFGADGTRLGGNNGRFNGGSVYNSWVWVRHGTTFTASNNQARTINLQRYEDGFIVDKIVLTRDTSTTYLSGAASPAESTRSQPPVATPVAIPAPGTYGGSAQVSLSSGTAGASIRYTLDGSTPTSTTGTLYSGPFTLNASATIKALAYKSGEGDSAVMSFSYTIVNSSNAAFTSAASTVAEPVGNVTVLVRRNGDAGGIATLQYATADGSATADEDYTATSGTLTWTDGDASDKSITVPILNDATYYEGDQSFTITLSNPIGIALGSPSTHVVTISDDDTDAPPVLTRLSPASIPASVTLGVALDLAYQAEDDGIDPAELQWSKFSGPGEVVFSADTAAATSAQFSATGNYVIRLTAYDGLHTVTSDFGVEVLPAIATYTLSYSAGTGGSLTGATPQTVAEGASGSPVTAVPDSGYRFTQWNDGSSANPRTDGNVTADLSVTANFAANQAPVISEGASVSVSMSEDGAPLAFSLTLNASDADDAPAALTWSIASQAAQGTASVSGSGASKAVGYAPQANWHGTDSFVVRVTDSLSATAEITVNVTVTPVNDAPVVANPPAPQTANIGQAFIYVFPANTFSDVDDAVLSHSATLADDSPLPGWLSFDPATRTFIGTPAAADLGIILIKLTATDSGAFSAQTSFAIQVSTAITTLHWGGGTTDLAGGTSVDSRHGDAALMAGRWDSTRLNWNGNLTATTGHRAWSDGNLAYFKFGATANFQTPDVELGQDILAGGLTVELTQSTPTNSGFDFISTDATPRALTLSPDSILRVRTPALSHSVALRSAGHVSGRGGVSLAGSSGFAYEAFNTSGVPNTAVLDIESGSITGPVEVRSGRLRIGAVFAGASGLPGISSFDIIGDAFLQPGYASAADNRIGNATLIRLSGGGLQLRTNSDPLQIQETVGSLTLSGSGMLVPHVDRSTNSQLSTLTLASGISRGPNGKGTLIVANAATTGGLGVTGAGVRLAGHGLTPSSLLPWGFHYGRGQLVGGGQTTDTSAGFLATDGAGELLVRPSVTGNANLSDASWQAYDATSDVSLASVTFTGALSANVTIRSLALSIGAGTTLGLGGNTLRTGAFGFGDQPGRNLTLGTADANRGVLTAPVGLSELYIHHRRQNTVANSLLILNAVIAGTQDVIFSGPNAQIVLAAANIHTGKTYLHAHTVRLDGSVAPLATTPEIHFAPFARLHINDSNQAFGNGTVAQVLAGGGASPIGVNLYSTNRSVTLGANATLAPGVTGANAAFRVDLGSGKLVLASGSRLEFDLGSPAQSDRLVFASAADWLAGSGQPTLVINPGPGFDYNQAYPLIENVTTEGLSFASITGHNPATHSAQVTKIGESYVLSFTPLAVEEYSITYLANGAPSGEVPVDVNTYAAGSGVTVLGNTGNLAQTGFSFNGWNTSAYGTGTAYAAGATLTMPAADVVLHAQWAALPAYDAWVDGIDWNGADSSQTADPENDGIANLLEYALGGNPLAPDANILPAAGIDGAQLTFRFTPGALDGIRYVIEASNNLSTWPEATDVTLLLTEDVEFSHSVNLSGTERKFLRLRINQDE